MNEPAIYADANARITPSLVTIEDTGFPVAAIASVRIDREKPGAPYLFAAGIAVLIGFVAGGWFTLIMLAIACMLVVAAFAYREDVLVIATVGGERAAFQSRNSDYVRQLRGAVEQAVAAGAQSTNVKSAAAPHRAENSEPRSRPVASTAASGL